MKRHLGVAILCLLLIGLLCSWPRLHAVERPDEDSVATEIKELLTEQVGRWNAGDIGGFMEYYWKSDDLTFSSGGTTRRGWDETLRRYQQRYPTPERMGHTTFSELEVRPLGDTAALVLGRWQLEREPDPIGGNFTLVLEKQDGRWVIIHDHTSQLEQPASSD